MPQTSDSRAVKLARAHVEAWAHKDFETARNGLATDVTATQSSTMPEIPRHDLAGVEDYMQGLILFAQSIVPGSVRVTDSNGDDGCALLMVTTPVDGATVWEADDSQRSALPIRRERQDRSRTGHLLHGPGLNQSHGQDRWVHAVSVDGVYTDPPGATRPRCRQAGQCMPGRR